MDISEIRYQDIPKAVSAGQIAREEGVLHLIRGLFSVSGPDERAANALGELGYDSGPIIYRALGWPRKPEDEKLAKEKLPTASADILVKWLGQALAQKAGIWYGQDENGRNFVEAKRSFHWDYAVRVSGWLRRKELIQPLVAQLNAEELGFSEVRRIGSALACFGDDGINALIPMLSETRLVWTRPAPHQMPVAERAFEALGCIETPKARKAARSGLSWWNLRRFDKLHRDFLKGEAEMKLWGAR